MNILCTGVCGFQGSHLAESLIADGHTVFGLNTPSDHAYNNYVKYLRDIGVIMTWGSVADKHIVDSIMKNDIEMVFHLGAKINVDESIDNPTDFYLINIIGTYNVLEAVKEHNAIMVFASTCETYGENTNPPKPMDENHPLRPFSPYAMSKCSADRMCYAYHRTHNLDIRILRPFNIYGERQKIGSKGAVIPTFFNQAMNDWDITIHGDGLQTRDYLHVTDVIQAYRIVMANDTLSGEVINVGSCEEHSIIEIAEAIVDIVGKGRIVHVDGRPGEVSSFVCDNTKIKYYGWKRKVDFYQGLKQYYQWLLGGSVDGKT